MGIVGVFLLWYFLVGRNNRKVYKKMESNFPAIIVFLILAGAFGSVVPAALSILLIIVVLIGIPVLVLSLLCKALFGSKSLEEPSAASKVRRVERTENTKKYDTSGLSKAVPKRKKCVKKFNEKYKLNLSDTEIERIIDASYVSEFWASEVAAMNRDYQSVAEWYKGGNDWFRVYIRSFPIQSISSDEMMQLKHCLDSYNEVFDLVESNDYADIDECIEDVNNKFFTNFDEIGFMIAYRFLSKHGRNVKLPGAKLIRNETTLEELQRKYDELEKSQKEKLKI